MNVRMRRLEHWFEPLLWQSSRFKTALELFYLGAGIVLISLALYLSQAEHKNSGQSH